MVFSKDPQQKYMYVADGTNNKVWILGPRNRQDIGSFGQNGKYAGQFHWVNAIGSTGKATSTPAKLNRRSEFRNLILYPRAGAE